jgi:DNA-3-methyladenine glycosylase
MGKKSLHSQPLPAAFYSGHTVDVAQNLLGKIVAVKPQRAQALLTGRIVETEAYRSDDPASHSARGITKRCAVMFGDPGYTYLYNLRGYHMLNFVTEPSGIPGAVLIRAIEPLGGLEIMKKLRPRQPHHNLASGPGKLGQALGLSMSDNGMSLQGPRIFVYDDGFRSQNILATPRIGITKAVDLPWRFVLGDSPFVSGLRFSSLSARAAASK